jgi:Putative DNA-binding domain
MNQTAFAAALLDPAAPLPEDVVTRTGADATRRFGVYRNNVIVSLIDALADSYTVVAALVGDEFFRSMAREFARQHPLRSPIMANYGDDFAEFIARFVPAATLPYLADLARLEWQRVVSWHAADEPSLGSSDIESLLSDPIALANTRWHFHPSVALIDSAWVGPRNRSSAQPRRPDPARVRARLAPRLGCTDLERGCVRSRFRQGASRGSLSGANRRRCRDRRHEVRPCASDGYAAA